MVFPLVVDHLQHNDALGLPHGVRPDQVLLLLVLLCQPLGDSVFDLLAVHAGELRGFDLAPELAQDIGF